MAAPARWRTKTRMAMRVSGVRLFELTSGAAGARACADGRLICVGILAAFILVVEIGEAVRPLTPGVFREQVAIATDHVLRLPTPRPMQCDEHAFEKALTLHEPAECFRGERYVVQFD